MNIVNIVKTAILASMLALSSGANAVLIDSASGAISLSGFDNTLDIVAGADIAAQGFFGGDPVSISTSGFDHIVNISGGIIQGNIEVNGWRHIFNISGGTLQGDIIDDGAPNSVFNFTGFDLLLSGSNVTGTLLDGSAIDVDFVGSFSTATIEVTNVPIPAAAWLFGSALLGLGALKRKKT